MFKGLINNSLQSEFVLLSFPDAVIKYPDTSNLGRNGFVSVHSPRHTPSFQEVQRQELEEVGHITSTSKNRAMNEDLLVFISLSPSLFHPGSQSGSQSGKGIPCSRQVFPPQLFNHNNSTKAIPETHPPKSF